MQDPRLKPVVVPPPTRPICTLLALAMAPAAGFTCMALLLRFAPADELSVFNPWAIPGHHAIRSLHYTTPVWNDLLFKLTLSMLISSLLGLILLGFATERNETDRPKRKAAFAANAFCSLLMVFHLFIYPPALDAVMRKLVVYIIFAPPLFTSS